MSMIVRSEIRLHLTSGHCVYCGDPADTKEHFPPRDEAGEFGTGLMLSACKECNSIAGRNHAFSFQDRSRYVNDRLRVRLRKYLDFPDWSEAELKQVSAKFRKEILGHLAMRERSRARIEWNAVSDLTSIAQEKRFSQACESIGLTKETAPGWWMLLNECFEEGVEA